MNVILRSFLEVYRLSKAAGRQLEKRREELEAHYPKGCEQLSEDSGGEIGWDPAGEEVNVEALPPHVRKAIRKDAYPVENLRAYLKIHGSRLAKKGVDTSTWFRKASGFILRVRPEGKAGS